MKNNGEKSKFYERHSFVSSESEDDSFCSDQAQTGMSRCMKVGQLRSVWNQEV